MAAPWLRRDLGWELMSSLFPSPGLFLHLESVEKMLDQKKMDQREEGKRPGLGRSRVWNTGREPGEGAVGRIAEKRLIQGRCVGWSSRKPLRQVQIIEQMLSCGPRAQGSHGSRNRQPRGCTALPCDQRRGHHDPKMSGLEWKQLIGT